VEIHNFEDFEVDLGIEISGRKVLGTVSVYCTSAELGEEMHQNWASFYFADSVEPDDYSRPPWQNDPCQPVPEADVTTDMMLDLLEYASEGLAESESEPEELPDYDDDEDEEPAND